MIRQILLGGATAVLFTGSASALTMNVTGDSRSVYAEAAAGFDFDSNSDSAAGNVFDSNVSASAQANIAPLIQNLGAGGGGGGFFGAVANAGASQFSEIGSLSISGSGFAEASGNHGEFNDVLVSDADSGAGGGGGLNFDSFQASSNSILDVMFSIDEDAAFDLSGFLFAGDQISKGPIGNDISNSASIILVNTDTNESAFKTEVSNDSTELNESGVLAAGNYQFMLRADAEVNGLGRVECLGCSTFTVAPINIGGYVTSAGYKGVSLDLTAIDQPIPEPVTTTLAAMGLGALVLRTSRRRHS